MSTERAANLARVRLGAGFAVEGGFDLGRVFGAGWGVPGAHIGAAHAGGPEVSKCATRSAGTPGTAGTVRAVPGVSFTSIWYLNPERPMSQSGRLPT
jgi:hypothetical protein